MESCQLSCGRIAAIAGLAGLAALFAWQMPDFKGHSSDWAAWVQAFGSVGAIMGAVFVSHMDNRRATERQAALVFEEGLRILESVRDELDMRWAQWRLAIGPGFEEAEANGEKMVTRGGATPAAPYVVYEGVASKLALVEDDRLRRRVIGAYASLEGLKIMVDRNSVLAERYWSSQSLVGGNAEKHRIALTQNYPSLKDSYDSVETGINTLLDDIQRYLVLNAGTRRTGGRAI